MARTWVEYAKEDGKSALNLCNNVQNPGSSSSLLYTIQSHLLFFPSFISYYGYVFCCILSPALQGCSQRGPPGYHPPPNVYKAYAKVDSKKFSKLWGMALIEPLTTSYKSSIKLGKGFDIVPSMPCIARTEQHHAAPVLLHSAITASALFTSYSLTICWLRWRSTSARIRWIYPSSFAWFQRFSVIAQMIATLLKQLSSTRAA